jgi:hypothetical protein
MGPAYLLGCGQDKVGWLPMLISGGRLLLEALFLGFAVTAFFTMLHLLGIPDAPHAGVLKIIHRVSGFAAVVLYVVVAVLMVRGIRQAEGISSPISLEIAFGAIFVPMILAKIVIVEKYPELRSRLFSNGTVLLIVAFIMFFTSLSSHLIRSAPIEPGAGEPTATDLELGRDLFVAKCAKCHRLDRALSESMTASEWRTTVERMRQKDPSWISEGEAAEITDFLTSLGEGDR